MSPIKEQFAIGISSSRSWIRHLHHRHLHGHVLQHHHCMGRVLLLCVAQVTIELHIAMAELWQRMEYS